MRWANKFAGYSFGVLLVLFGFLWIESTMTIPVIFIGSIGLILVLVGFAIIYLGHISGRQKKLLQ